MTRSRTRRSLRALAGAAALALGLPLLAACTDNAPRREPGAAAPIRGR